MTETNKPTTVPSKTKFNFILENGLQYKYLLEPDFIAGYLEEEAPIQYMLIYLKKN